LSVAPYAQGTYVFTASTNTSTAWRTFSTQNSPWSSATSTYDSNTGAYLGAIITTSAAVNYPGEYLQMQSPQSFIVKGFILRSQGVNPRGDPKRFQLFGSTDASTWTLLYNQTVDEVFADRAVSKQYTVANNTAYLYYRLVIESITPSAITISSATFYALLLGVPPTRVSHMQITSDLVCVPYANVGIGMQATPAAKLHIEGPATFNGNPIDVGVSQLLISNNVASSYANDLQYGQLRLGFMVDSSNSYSAIQTGLATSIMRPLCLNPVGGRVGIGTTNPVATLHVTGDIFTLSNITAGVQFFGNVGVASSPGYAFTGDPNTGMYAAAADTLAFSTNGSERVRVSSTGNFGIGTDNPLTKAHIWYTGAGDILRVDDDTNDTTPFIINDVGNIGMGTNNPITKAHIWYTGTGDILRVDDDTNDTTPFIINDVGNIGMGTNNPIAKAHIWYNGTGDVFRVDDTNNDTTPFIITNTGSVGIGSSIPLNKVQVTVTTAAAALQVRQNGTGNIIEANDSGTNVVVIQAGGNVGIGTTTTLAKTHIWHTGTGDILRVDDQSADTSPFIINELGSVGIGVTSVLAALHVNGLTRTTKIEGIESGVNKQLNIVGDATRHNVVQFGDVNAGTANLSIVSPVISAGGWSGSTAVGDTVMRATTGSLHIAAGSGTSIANLVLTSTGNIGIGTTTPTAYLQFAAGTTAVSPLRFTSGANLTAATGGCVEYDGSSFYMTSTSASGRGEVVLQYSYRYTSTGSALGPTIADYFPASSSISLDAGGYYEIEAMCYFLKTTNGTITWTWAFSSAVTMARSQYQGCAVTGFTTTISTAAPITGVAVQQTTTALAHAATASLTTAVFHHYNFKVHVVTNLATNARLRITSSAGTVTPQAGSYYTVKKIGTNTGTFAA
jgi:hypothetical protein